MVAFAALVLFHGMLVAALAGRLSRAVPLLAPTARALVAYVPLLLLALGSVALVAGLVGIVVVLASQVPAVAVAWRDRRALFAGRVVLALVALVALPSFASAVVNIWADLRSIHRRVLGGPRRRLGEGLEPGLMLLGSPRRER